MKSKTAFTVCVFFLSALHGLTANSQTPNLVWAKQTGGSSCISIGIDANGNVYTSGNFYGTSDFDPGPDTYNMTSAGNSDIFVAKFDACGNFVWAKNGRSRY